MKALIALSLALSPLFAACSKKEESTPPPAAMPASPVATPAAVGASPEVQAITAYVDGIEAEFRDRYTKKELALTPEQLQGITDAPWAKLHAYVDAGAVKRIKLYPAAGSAKVEEFYFRDGQLVYVSDEPQGNETQREEYFFANGALIAAIEATGNPATLDDAEKAKGAKLVAEAASFLKLASAAP